MAALKEARDKHGIARILVNCAGIGTAKRIVGKDGPQPLADFERVIKINLIGTFNLMRLVAARSAERRRRSQDGERGVIISTASVAAYEGQIGQAAYAASKGGIVALTIPAARELAQFGIRVLAIAPGIFLTPMLMGFPRKCSRAWRPRCRFRNCSASRSNTPISSLHMVAESLSRTAKCPPRWRLPHGAALMAMLVNKRTVRIEWGDCDPAGIVYYPRYFAIFDHSTAHAVRGGDRLHQISDAQKSTTSSAFRWWTPARSFTFPRSSATTS